MTIQTTKCKIWSSFDYLCYNAKSQVRGVWYPRLRDFFFRFPARVMKSMLDWDKALTSANLSRKYFSNSGNGCNKSRIFINADIFAEPRIGPDQGATDKEEERNNSCTFFQTKKLIGWHYFLRHLIGWPNEGTWMGTHFLCQGTHLLS